MGQLENALRSELIIGTRYVDRVHVDPIYMALPRGRWDPAIAGRKLAPRRENDQFVLAAAISSLSRRSLGVG